MGDEFNDRFKRDQGLGTPVDGNVGEEPMFDLVPFAGSWRKMTHGDGESGFVCQPLHLTLPQAAARTVGATSIRSDQQVHLLGLHDPAILPHTASDNLDRHLHLYKE